MIVLSLCKLEGFQTYHQSFPHVLNVLSLCKLEGFQTASMVNQIKCQVLSLCKLEGFQTLKYAIYKVLTAYIRFSPAGALADFRHVFLSLMPTDDNSTEKIYNNS